MKTIYTAPKLSTLNVNGIKDLFSIDSIPYGLRIITVSDILVRIEINKDGYVELQTNNEEVDISRYYEILKGLTEFFYGTAYLYGTIKNGLLEIYDIYTNDNFLSTKDLEFLNKEYQLPIILSERVFTSEDCLESISDMLKEYDLECIHILPTVYINDKRESKLVEEKITEKVIIGEKKTYPVWNGYNKPATVQPATVKKPEEIYEVFQFSTKQEREQIFEETYKNISSYIEKNKFSKEELEWWKKNGKFLTYLYAIHTLPSTRKLVYDYSNSFYLPYYERNTEDYEKWAVLFFEMFDDIYYEDFISKKIDLDFDDLNNFKLFFKEELKIFNFFFEKEETNLNYFDWRDGENYFYDDLDDDDVVFGGNSNV